MKEKMEKVAHIFSKNILSDRVSEKERRDREKETTKCGKKVSKIEFA